jgi:hypothetical protein
MMIAPGTDAAALDPIPPKEVDVFLSLPLS